MKSSPLEQLAIEFIGSFPDPAHALAPPLPEIAFLGRSNVGKSSLLNALTGRHGLARVSGTPGKTRALNVFRLPAFYLVDLPGYGYAKADKGTRTALQKLIRGYIGKRERLAGVVWLLDIRREPSDDDLHYLEALSAREVPVLAALTKSDKVAFGARRTRETAIRSALGLEADQVQATSSTTGLGIAELGASILAAVPH